MVATHSHPRRPSNTGSMGHSSSRTRRRSSLRRQAEKSAPTVAAAVTARNSAQQRRSRSVSTGTSQHSQQQQLRRPSAPAVVEMPRLSIADRFMALNYSKNPSSSSPPPLPQTSLQQQRSTSPSISLASNSILNVSNSALSDTPTTASNSKLSVADRFMSTSSKSNIISPAQSTLNLQQQYRDRSGSAFSTKTKSATSAESELAVDPVHGRLTIASAFMKSSSTLAPTPDTSRSRAASFADELDMGVSSSRVLGGGRKPSQVHPLEPQQSKSTLFDDTTTSHLNLDLSIASPSASSSVLNHFDSVRNNRPWGSQDTLVHPHLEKKKPIYAQFIDSEKDATADRRSFSLGDYFVDSPANNRRSTMMSDDRSARQYDDYEDIEIDNSYQKYDKHHQRERPWEYEDDENDEEHYGDEEKRSYYRDDHNNSPVNSTAKLNKKKKLGNSSPSMDEEYEESRGFWVGCCFVSCGQRPSRRIIEEHQKQRRKKEIEQQQQESRPKSRGFGGRGWVFCTFISLIVLVLVSYFLWPRTPLMRIEGASLTTPAKITETKQGVMVGNVAFESEWLVNITVDNRQNHVPTRLVQVQILAKDALTGLVIGKGLHNDDPNPEHIVLAPNAISTIQIPIRVDYQARDSTDTTLVNLSKACSPQQSIPVNTHSSHQRESLPLHFWITLHFFGLDWLNYKPTVIATPATGGFACPQS